MIRRAFHHVQEEHLRGQVVSMPRFYFQTMHARSDEPDESIQVVADDEAAREAGRRLLTTAAAEGLPDTHGDMIAVEIFDGDRQPLLEVRLVYEEIAKPAR